MKYVIAILAVVSLLMSASYAEVNVRGVYAGGAAGAAFEFTRALRADLTGAFDIGYCYNSEYSLIALGLSVAKPLRSDLEAGLVLTYSSYSTPVRDLILIKEVSEKAGAGAKLFVRKALRNALYGEVGYDTRMGLTAAIGLNIRK